MIAGYDVTPWPSYLGVRCRPKRSFVAGSRCGLRFWCPASVYLHRASLLDQNARLFSIGDAKTCWFIIRYRRYISDSLKIPFCAKIVIFVVHARQRGVNRGSVGKHDTLA